MSPESKDRNLFILVVVIILSVFIGLVIFQRRRERSLKETRVHPEYRVGRAEKSRAPGSALSGVQKTTPSYVSQPQRSQLPKQASQKETKSQARKFQKPSPVEKGKIVPPFEKGKKMLRKKKQVSESEIIQELPPELRKEVQGKGIPYL
jgi:hypothetical protein